MRREYVSPVATLVHLLFLVSLIGLTYSLNMSNTL